MPPALRSRATLVLAAALAAVSIAAIFVRLAQAPGVVVALYRMLLASLLLLPVTVRGLRRTPLRGRPLLLTLAAGVLLGIHFATWITSIGLTTVAASVTLVTTAPLWVALFAWLFTGLTPSFSVLAGVVMAVAGAAVIGFGDLVGGVAAAGNAPLVGDGLALVGAASVSGYLLLGRAVQRSGVRLDAYAGVAYATAAVVLAPLPLLLGQAYTGYPLPTLGWIALLALVPQLIGHTGINYAMRHLEPTLVTTLILLEPIGSGLLALLIFGEVPSFVTMLGAAVLLAGVVFTARSSGAPVQAPAPTEVPGP